MEPAVITTENLCKYYQQGLETIRAVDHVSLSIQAGDLAVITGRSGSGKTTLLSLLGGLTRPDSGSARVFDQDLTQIEDAALSALRGEKLGFVFQFPSLIPTLTVFDNMRLPGLFAKKPVETARIKYLLDWIGLTHRAGSFPAELSGGQSARISLARALVKRPAILFADEPTGNLDVETEIEILNLLVEINKNEGTTVLLVTHNPEMAVYGNRHLVIHQGQLQKEVQSQTPEATHAG
jgi:ABC-type lipoprotein export system ATPase subunit